MTRLLTDEMLGRLTTYLRMCGHDTLSAVEAGLDGDDTIRDRANADARRLLTRDRALAGRTENSLCLESKAVTDQLAELHRAGIDITLAEPPVRCSTCNGPITAVSIDAVTPSYAPDSTEFDLWRCTECDQHYWKGSHWTDVRETLTDVRAGCE